MAFAIYEPRSGPARLNSPLKTQTYEIRFASCYGSNSHTKVLKTELHISRKYSMAFKPRNANEQDTLPIRKNAFQNESDQTTKAIS